MVYCNFPWLILCLVTWLFLEASSAICFRSFCACVQPMRNNATLSRCLIVVSLAGRMYKWSLLLNQQRHFVINSGEILINIQDISVNKMPLNMLSAKSPILLRYHAVELMDTAVDKLWSSTSANNSILIDVQYIFIQRKLSQHWPLGN